MLSASHLISHAVPGHDPSDGRCQKAFIVSPCSSCTHYKRFPEVKVAPFRCSSRGNLSFICNANSSGQRRNPDFSKQDRHGFSRNKNRQSEDRDGIDSFGDSEVFSSKNGQSFHPGSPSPRFQSASSPGPREREIVEIFRKVQAQLRERAAQKEEKKVEDSQGHSKQNETVDSLLKLLRKHSVQHGKSSNSSRNNREFVLENRSPKDSKEEVQSSTEVQSTRPASNFQRRSPVPRIKYKPILSGEEEPFTIRGKRVSSLTDMETGSESTREPEMETGSEVEGESEGFDESSDDEVIDSDEIEEGNVVENGDLGSMKLVELRAVAKARGVKGFSRLKKGELLELLSD